jgi:hypothetical protein
VSEHESPDERNRRTAKAALERAGLGHLTPEQAVLHCLNQAQGWATFLDMSTWLRIETCRQDVAARLGIEIVRYAEFPRARVLAFTRDHDDETGDGSRPDL